MQMGYRHNSRFSTNSWLSINDCCSANNNCGRPPCSLPHTPSRISQYCISQPAWMTSRRRKRYNRPELFIRSGKSEAQIALDVLLKLLTDTKHRAASLRSLSATAALLVPCCCNDNEHNLKQHLTGYCRSVGRGRLSSL